MSLGMVNRVCPSYTGAYQCLSFITLFDVWRQGRTGRSFKATAPRPHPGISMNPIALESSTPLCDRNHETKASISRCQRPFPRQSCTSYATLLRPVNPLFVREKFACR